MNGHENTTDVTTNKKTRENVQIMFLKFAKHLLCHCFRLFDKAIDRTCWKRKAKYKNRRDKSKSNSKTCQSWIYKSSKQTSGNTVKDH